MKKVLFTVALLGVAASVLAQGTIAFNNRNASFQTPIFGPETGNNALSKAGNSTIGTGTGAGSVVYTGSLLSGSGYMAQLFAGAQGTAADALAAATPINTFRTGSFAGFIPNITATIGNVGAGVTASMQLRVWDNTSGQYATWAAAEAAWKAGTIAAGTSTLFTTDPLGGVPATGGSPVATPSLGGLQSFNIYYQIVPEPSTMALAGLGAAAMLIFRRRK